ncbi:MAG: glycosyltransferase family 2 protein [Treponema sp.]|nr:glycosyltransferase family 2 protein [Treponema sp.]
MSGNKPLVSIIVPSYNHEKYIEYCLNSIIAQTYDNIELFIIDDASKDNSFEVAKKLESKLKQRFPKVYLEKHEENHGLCRTLNETIPLTNGKYLAIFASDDYMFPERIEKQVIEMEKPENTNVAFCHSGYATMDENNDLISGPVVLQPNEANCTNKDKILKIFRDGNYLCAPTFFWNSIILKTMLPYDEDVILEDFFMQIKTFENGFANIYIYDTLVLYRVFSLNTLKRYPEKHILNYLKILSSFKRFCVDNLILAEYYLAIHNFIMLHFHTFNYEKWKTVLEEFSLPQDLLCKKNKKFSKSYIKEIIKFFIPYGIIKLRYKLTKKNENTSS